ncbi:MAG: glycosyltransferase [Candidatus Abyssubacteria bacterium]|nr:glycosyltransferase [Candidatus Abyssubacteria bacterium]
MNILFCNKFFYAKGGAEVSMFETARILEKKGHNLAYFSMHHPSNVATPFSKYFVSNVDFNGGSWTGNIRAAGRILYSFEARRQIRKLLHEHAIDVVHLNNIYHQISPSILHEIRKKNIPIVMSLRDYKLVCPNQVLFSNGGPCDACRGGRYYNAIFQRCHKDSYLKSALVALEMTLHHRLMHIYDSVNVFIATSRFLKDKITEMGFKGEIVVLPNFVNIEDYPPPSYALNGSHAVYFGRLSHEKGLMTLCDAVKGLDLTLHFIGNGPQKQALMQKVGREEISNIKFWGHQPKDRLMEMVSKATFVVLPSEWHETFGRTALEAFAMGKPVVGARMGGIPELVKDGETGVTFEPGNADDLRKSMQTLLNAGEEIIRIGRRARELVERELDAEKHYDGLMKIYRKTLADKGMHQ